MRDVLSGIFCGGVGFFLLYACYTGFRKKEFFARRHWLFAPEKIRMTEKPVGYWFGIVAGSLLAVGLLAIAFQRLSKSIY